MKHSLASRRNRRTATALPSFCTELSTPTHVGVPPSITGVIDEPTDLPSLPYARSVAGGEEVHMATGSEAAKPSPKPDLLARANDTDGIRILFVEDDDLCREAIAAELSEHGFVVQSFADGAALLASLDASAGAEVIILDWSLPQTSGIDLLPELRRRGIDVPVVFLTGRSLTTYESLAFERGAIDFIDKTRGVEILVR